MVVRRLISIACAALALGSSAAPAQSDWRRALERFERQVGEIFDELTLTDETGGQYYGLFVPPAGAVAAAASHIKHWRDLGDIETPPRSVVLLVHGLDEPGDIWDDLAPAIVGNGHAVVRFEYANDQRVHKSAAQLIDALKEARAAGVVEIRIVAHSMGGLVAFDAFTRQDGFDGDMSGGTTLPRVEHFIAVGTPWEGSPWARLRKFAEVRDQVQRWLKDDSWDIRPMLNPDRDGVGQAGADLAEGSALIEELAARPMPAGLPLTVLAGRIAPSAPADLAWLRESEALVELFGRDRVNAFVTDVTSAGGRLGDGVVPIESALARGADDTVIFEVNHRGMIRRSPIDFATGSGPDGPPGIALILDRLGAGPKP